jgi:molybdate transport system substrate-binding protein
MAVKAGAPIPDIRSMDALRRTLLAAKSVAWSDSASGVYLQGVLFPRMGLSAAMQAKGRMIPAAPVGEAVAKGQAEVGFQQLSELRPIAGISIVGLLPREAQKITMFSAGAVARSSRPEQARKLIRFLSSARASNVIGATGLLPVGVAAQ